MDLIITFQAFTKSLYGVKNEKIHFLLTKRLPYCIVICCVKYKTKRLFSKEHKKK